MKKLLLALILSVASLGVLADGLIKKDQAQTGNFAPSPVVSYRVDCDFNGMASGLASTIASVTVGIVTTTTITETDGVNVWVSTVVNDGAGTITTTCPQLQGA